MAHIFPPPLLHVSLLLLLLSSSPSFHPFLSWGRIDATGGIGVFVTAARRRRPLTRIRTEPRKRSQNAELDDGVGVPHVTRRSGGVVPRILAQSEEEKEKEGNSAAAGGQASERMLQSCVGDAGSLSSRLQNAYNGEIIYVCSGTISVGSEMFVSSGSVTLSCVGTARSCILDGGESGRILTVNGNSFTLSGMALRRGNGGSGNGGALQLIGGGNHRIVNSQFVENSANNGGAVYNGPGSSISVQNSSFDRNTANSQGGAASLYQTLDAHVNSGSGNKATQCNDFYLQTSGLCQNLNSNPSPIPAPFFAPTPSPLPPQPPVPPPFPSPGPGPSPDRTCVYDYNDLSDRLRTASNGDTVSVCSVTIAIRGEMQVTANSVTLSCFGAPGSCILSKSGGYGGRILNVLGGSFTLDGLSLRDAYNSGGDGGAVAIFGDGSHTIRQCDFRNNQSGGLGGGLWVTNEAGRVFMSACRFSNNRSSLNGGGAAFKNTYDVNMQNNDFDGNTSNNGAGGFFLSYVQVARVNGGLMSNNRSNDGGGGGAIITYCTDVVVDGTDFDSNRSSKASGGMRVYYSNINIRNANFRKNLAEGHSGGFSIEGDGSNSYIASVSNVLLENNEARSNYGGGFTVLTMPNSNVELSSFFFNRAPNNSGGAAYLTTNPKTSAGGEGAQNYAFNCDDVYVTSDQACYNLQPTTTDASYVVLTPDFTADLLSSNATRRTSVNDSGRTTLSDLSEEERQKLRPILASHLKEWIQENINATVLNYVQVNIADVGLVGEADAGNVFAGEFHFDDVPYYEGEPVTSSTLQKLILSAFIDDMGEEFVTTLRQELGGDLGSTEEFNVSPVALPKDAPDDDAVVPLDESTFFSFSY